MNPMLHHVCTHHNFTDYYTLHGNASIGGCTSSEWGSTLASWRAQAGYGAFEENSTTDFLPSPSVIIQWARDVLNL